MDRRRVRVQILRHFTTLPLTARARTTNISDETILVNTKILRFTRHVDHRARGVKVINQSNISYVGRVLRYRSAAAALAAFKTSSTGA